MNKNKSTQVIIEERLLKLNKAIKVLKGIRQKYSKTIFLSNDEIQFSAFYGLVMGIEAICDIGAHILSKYYGESYGSYKDIIQGLGKFEIVSHNLAKDSEEMPDFRNVLIHVYTEIDSEEVYTNLQKAPEEFTKFAKYFLKFLEKINK